MKEWKPFYENWRGTRRLPCSYNFSTHKWALSFWRTANHHSYLFKEDENGWAGGDWSVLGNFIWLVVRNSETYTLDWTLVKLVVGSCHKDCSYDEGKSNLFVTVRKAGDDRRPPACILHSDSHRENYTSVTNGFWNFWVYNVHTTVQIGVYLACDEPKVTHNQQCWTFYTTVLLLNTKIS